MRHQLNNIMEASIAPSTRNTYATGTRAYIHFCNQIGHSPFPLNQETLRLFVTSLYNRISYKSIKVYLAGIQYASVLRGGSHTIENTRLLHYTLWDIWRLQGDQFKRQIRAHVTLGHLHHLHAYFDRHFIIRDADMLKAATLLAFFGLLRASEYLSETAHSSHHGSPLLTSDIRIATDHSHMKVAIRKSKTDPFRNGCSITIWATRTSLCPLQAMERFLSRYSYLNGALFRFFNGCVSQDADYQSVSSQLYQT